MEPPLPKNTTLPPLRSQNVGRLPFSSNLKHVKNVDMMLQCEECESWRLLYSQKKLTHRERTQLEEDLDLTGKVADVYVRDIVCGKPIQKIYYSAKYPPICVYCATPVDPDPKSDDCLQCTDCSGKPHIKKN